MKKILQSRLKLHRFRLPLLGFCLLLTGCIVCENCGSIRRSHDITTLFLNNEVVPGYTYYYNGELQWPKAILAIDAGYTVEAEFWKPVDLTGQELSDWMDRTSTWKGTRQTEKNGAEVFNPAGERIGVFFSKYDNLVTKFPGGNVVQVYPPSYQAGQGLGPGSKDRN